MYIYVFESNLFYGQSRKIISSYPIPIDKLLELVNYDNNYAPKDKWELVKCYS